MLETGLEGQKWRIWRFLPKDVLSKGKVGSRAEIRENGRFLCFQGSGRGFQGSGRGLPGVQLGSRSEGSEGSRIVPDPVPTPKNRSWRPYKTTN